MIKLNGKWKYQSYRPGPGSVAAVLQSNQLDLVRMIFVGNTVVKNKKIGLTQSELS